MNKTELIHTHGILAEIRQYTDAETPDYEALGVGPISLHAGAEDHKEAVFCLADELARTLPAESAEALA